MRYKRCCLVHSGELIGVNFFYQGRRVLVTGGLGFIGSNLSLRLAAEGARVTVVDSAVAGCGANRRNLHGNIPGNPECARGIDVIECDVGSPDHFAEELRAAGYTITGGH